MANKTSIEWADLTINPIIGCTKCSPGCDNCYAETFAARLAKNPATQKRYSQVISDGKWNGKVSVDFKVFAKLPVSGKPQRIFVGSMGDVFHESVGADDILRLFECMQMFPQHTFMLLTKRPDRMKELICLERDCRARDDDAAIEGRAFREWPLPNVWLGTSVTHPGEIKNILVLATTPAAKRFVSFEPLLGYVKMVAGSCGHYVRLRPNHDMTWPRNAPEVEYRRLIDWVIVGGETGDKARPLHPEWVRSIRDECREAGIPFFFKHWGEWVEHAKCCDSRAEHVWLLTDGNVTQPHTPRAEWLRKVGRYHAGCLIDGVVWKEVPE